MSVSTPTRHPRVASLAVRIAWAGVLLAAGPGCASPEQSASGFLVVGAASLPEFEGARDSMTVPFVVSRVDRAGRGIEVEGLQARLDLAESTTLRAGPTFSVTLPRIDATSEVIAQLDERNVAVEVGGFVGFRTPLSMLREGALTGTLSARQDVTGVHDGLLITGKLEAFFAANYMLRFGAGISATAASSEYMDTYYSSEAGNAAGLDAFDADAGVKDVTFEVFSILSFSETLGIFTRAAYTQLLGDARRSPIVRTGGSDEQLFLGGGLFWRF